MIEVFSNGLKFSYWTDASITRSLSNIAAGFQLSLVNQNGQGNRIRFFSGDLIEIDIDGIGAIKGFVGPLSVSFGEGSETLSVTGYEMTCDLVDCCVTQKMEWNDRKADQIIKDICSEFGISFYNPNNVDFGAAIKNFSIDPGTKAIDAISKICRSRGLLPCSNGMGKVFVIKPSDCPRGPKLAQGVNIVSATASYNANALYSDYFVYGTGKAKKEIQAHVSDPTVRKRPLVIVDTDAIDKETVTARAEWERSIRRARGISYSISVKGWKRDETHLWEPGIICAIESSTLLVDDPIDMLVSQVSYSFGQDGENTTLVLVPVDSFEPEPETKKPQANKSPKRKAVNVWSQIKKTVQKK